MTVLFQDSRRRIWCGSLTGLFVLQRPSAKYASLERVSWRSLVRHSRRLGAAAAREGQAGSAERSFAYFELTDWRPSLAGRETGRNSDSKLTP